MKKILLISIVSVALLFGCKSKKEATQVESTVVEVMDTIPEPVVNRDSLIAIEIAERVSQIDSNKHKINDRFIFSNTVLPMAYQKKEYSQLWKSEKNRADAIEALLSSKEHGLLPEDYHVEEILNYNSNYDSLTNEELANYDILLTDGVLLYGFHLIRGKVDPETLSSTWNFMGRKLPEVKTKILLGAIENEKLPEELYKLEPQDNEYQVMQEYLVWQERIIENGGWSSVYLSSTIHPGESDTNMPALRNRLIAENYLTAVDTSSSTVYDEKLVEGMKKFQKRHGLNADGVLGKATMKMVNITAEEKRQMLVTNLDRRRWLNYPSEGPYIKVNIASFRMIYIDNGKVTYASNVVVGKTQKQTPMFSDRMKLVVFNPTWTLPFSITSTETLSKLKKDPNYLQKHNMVLIDHKGNIIDSHGIDWHKYSEGHFPYMVRQEPGPSNALGQVKFLFPNKYAIYLHDTPSKHLFSRDERAFSHGCIRLQNPLNFAQFLLSKQDTSWTMDKINAIIKTRETETIRLKPRIPIYLLYQTVGVNEENELYFYHDIYNRDDKVYETIMQPETITELEDSLKKE